MHSKHHIPDLYRWRNQEELNTGDICLYWLKTKVAVLIHSVTAFQKTWMNMT